MNNDYVALTEDGIQPRDKAPDSAVIIKPARRRYDGQEVAVVTGADWVGICEDVIERRCHSTPVPVEQATDLAWWLYKKRDSVRGNRAVQRRVMGTTTEIDLIRYNSRRATRYRAWFVS